jgi:outer membrane protein TolC
VQSIYEGGRRVSSWRSASLTRERADQDYQTIVADILLDVRVAYADVLLAEELITVQEASVHLLQQELEDTRSRFEAGTVPHFNVLRAEVEVANARPRLIRARNDSRIARQRLVNLLGYDLPRAIQEDVPVDLSDQLVARPYDIELSGALVQALENRSELMSLEKNKLLREEEITQAKAGYKPSLQLFVGYGSRNSLFSSSLRDDVSGWNAGAQLSWDLFDGLLTQGDIKEAEARYNRSLVELEDIRREIELEVRTAYSNFIEANEVLESQKKVTEQAEEALRLATGRFRAGTGTQLDVLSAQTALTEARSTYVQALRDYTVARARLERAIGQSVERTVTPDEQLAPEP